MNFLAHLFLAGSNQQIRFGNFIGDWVKGNRYKSYAHDVQKGIVMHRFIDHFTDHHDCIRASNARLKSRFHKHAGIITDIFYDHLLIENWHIYAKINLGNFIHGVYKMLIMKYFMLPGELKAIVPIIIANKRLESYSSLDGLHKVFKIMANYTSLPNEPWFAIRVLQLYFKEYQNEFNEFFPAILNEVSNRFEVHYGEDYWEGITD